MTWKNHVWVALSLYEHPRRPSTSETLTIFGLRSSKLEKLFLTGFFGRHFVFRMKNQHGWRFSDIEKKALPLPGHLDRFKMVHVDSQIKDSSNSFRRRHSSEGVDAKFSSTLPKDSAVRSDMGATPFSGQGGKTHVCVKCTRTNTQILQKYGCLLVFDLMYKVKLWPLDC